MPEQVSLKEFAARIRERRPDLVDVPDVTLVGKTLAAAPQLKQYVNMQDADFNVHAPASDIDMRTAGDVANDQLLSVNKGITGAITGIPGFFKRAADSVWSIDKPEGDLVHGSLKNANDLASDTLHSVADPLTTIGRGLVDLAGGPQGPDPSSPKWDMSAQATGGTLTSLIAPELVNAGISKIKTTVRPPSPHQALSGGLDQIVDGISQFKGTRAELGDAIRQAVDLHKENGRALPLKMQQEVLDTLQGEDLPKQQVTKVRTGFTNVPKVAVTSPDLPEPIKNSAGQAFSQIGETTSPLPRPLTDNITDASAGLEEEVADNPPGPPSSAADPVNKQGIATGLKNETVEQSLKRLGRKDLLDQWQTANKMLDDVNNNSHINLLQKALEKNPDRAYNILISPNTTLADIAGMRKVVEPTVFRAMTAQVLNDLLTETVTKSLATDSSVAGVRSAAGSLSDALHSTKPNSIGYHLKGIMDSAEYDKLDGLAKTMAATQVPPANWILPIAKLATHWIAGAKGAALDIGIGAISRMMTKPEGLTNIREYVRAIGRSDAKRIAFYGGRISDFARREFSRQTGQQQQPQPAMPLPPIPN